MGWQRPAGEGGKERSPSDCKLREDEIKIFIYKSSSVPKRSTCSALSVTKTLSICREC